MIGSLLEPFEFAFFRNGMLVAVLAGALCGVVGTYVVLRGMSYIGHGLSHAIFGGAAASAVLGLNYFLGAGVWGLASALLIGRVAQRSAVRSDAAIGVVTTAGFAVGLALFAIYGQARRDLDTLLFGSILGVGTDDVWVVASVTVACTGAVLLVYRQLLFVTFDPEVAAVSGVRVGVVDAILMAVLAATVLATMQVLGVTLVAAGLVIPPATARLLTNRFARMLWLSPALGAGASAVGIVASYHLDIPPGAAIVLTSTAVFVAAYLTRIRVPV